MVEKNSTMTCNNAQLFVYSKLIKNLVANSTGASVLDKRKDDKFGVYLKKKKSVIQEIWV